jgi:hypothetical protein
MDGDRIYRGVGRALVLFILTTICLEARTFGDPMASETQAAQGDTRRLSERLLNPSPPSPTIGDAQVYPVSNLEPVENGLQSDNADSVLGQGLAPQQETLAQQSQKLGEAPPPTNLQFLRRQSVLLKPCEWQLDAGFSYMYHEDELSLTIPPITIVRSRIRQRILTIPLEFRYGLTENMQVFVNAPLGWANTETSQLNSDTFLNNGGIGDTNTGATFHLFKSNGLSCSPDVIATFGLTAPTGKGDALFGLFQTAETTLGQGYWAGFWNVLFIHQYDPVTVFYGFGSRHYMTKDLGAFTAKPGDQFTYELGTGFAVNERITLSTTFFGSYVTEARINNNVVQGTILEPMYVRFATTISRPKRICEPFVEIGLTNAAANSRVGITWTF